MKSFKDFSLLFGLLAMSMLLVQCGASKKKSDDEPPKKLKVKKVKVRQIPQPEGTYNLMGHFEVEENLTNPANVVLVNKITEVIITNTQNSAQTITNSGNPIINGIEINGAHEFSYIIAEGLGAIPSNVPQENITVDVTFSYLGGVPVSSLSENVEYLFEYD